ncbi:DUF2975 domain-containing protein [Aeromonas schubertii]|uniref:DUF2975 domain-containing protein n=1 Tax=Aeromonas schubertii TaxID=652 RepID=A0ABS7VBL7_9GAMM|nr:DUF2975 domain-containing protein [Aeromonas schubertii]MBZ6066792.1 DUF2975 domain-containing protein [Aeromonas schubertii]
MTSNKLERMSTLIEWILLFAMLATPLLTIAMSWSYLLGSNDFLQDQLINVLGGSGAHFGYDASGTTRIHATPHSLDAYPLTISTRLLATLVILLPDVVQMLILWQLHQLFSGYRHGMLFTLSQIGRYRMIGLGLCSSFFVSQLTTPLLGAVLTMNGPKLHGSITVGSADFRTLLAGLIVLALALVMGEAKRLADDQALTV